MSGATSQHPVSLGFEKKSARGVEYALGGGKLDLEATRTRDGGSGRWKMILEWIWIEFAIFSFAMGR